MSKPRSLDKSTKEDVSFIDRQPDQLTNQSVGQAEPEVRPMAPTTFLPCWWTLVKNVAR